MQFALAAFSSAVTSSSQQIAYSVNISLPATTYSGAAIPSSYGNVTDCLASMNDFYRQITTSTPETTTLISGYPSAQPEIVFAGPLSQGDGVVPNLAQTIYWLFNPYDPTSPLYRQARTGLVITVKLGLYDGSGMPDLVTVFTGTIDQVECDIDGSVTMTCLDFSNTISDQATLPPVITNSPFNAGLTNEYAIDYLLRHSSPAQYYSWPAQRTNCVLAVGMRASIWPEVGSYASYAQQPAFGAGLYGSALTGQSFLTAYTLAAPLGTDVFFQCFASSGFELKVNDFPVVNHLIIQQSLASSTLVVYTITPSGTASGTAITSTTGVIHRISAQLHWAPGSASVTGTLWLDGTPHTVSFTALDARTGGDTFTIGAVTAGVGSTIEGVQITSESAGTDAAFAPTLLMDPGGSLNPLTALPDITGQTTWQVLQDIAASEAAVIGFNELGQAFFTNRETIQSMVSARTVTSTTSLMDLASLEQQSLVATHVQIPVNQLTINPVGSIWNAAQIYSAPANGTLTVILQLSNIVVNISSPGVGYWHDPSSGQNVTSYRASTTADGTGLAVMSGITTNYTQLSPTLVQLSIVNTNSFPVFFVSPSSETDTPAGTPFLFLVGRSVTSANTLTGSLTGTVSGDGGTVADAQWPTIADGGAVSNLTYGEVLLQISNNSWIQDYVSAQALAEHYLEDLFTPKPLVRNINMVPDPRLQNLDRITLIDSDISGISSDAQVIGINMSLSNGTYSQAIDARLWARPGAWILGVSGSSELNVTTWIY